MLQEFNTTIQTKEKFLAEYTPIRTAVENFLRGGEKIKGQNPVLYALNVASVYLPFVDKDFPLGKNLTYWKRETAIPSTHGPSVPVVVETERVLSELTHYSDQVDKADIRVMVGSSPDALIIYLPPVWAIQQNVIGFKNFVNIPQLLSDVLPHLH